MEDATVKKRAHTPLSLGPLGKKLSGWLEALRRGPARKRLEDDLKRSENKYQRIFDGSQDMILIINKDGKIKEVNQAGVNLLGYKNKLELLSLPSVETLYHDPKHWRVFKTQIDRHGSIRDYEAGFMKKDGTRLHCLLSGNATLSGDGTITGYEGIAKDITARMDAIRNLRKRHWELWLLNSVAFAMNKGQDLDEILMTALRKALEVLNFSAGGIFLIDHQAHVFSLRAQVGFDALEKSNKDPIVLHDRMLMEALLRDDLTLEPVPIFPPFKAKLQTGDTADALELTCFLITAKQKASGFLAFWVPPARDLTSGQSYHLLGSLGNFLGGAIENALLHQTVEQHREELKELTAQLFQSQEEERRRIARELHDEAGQAMTGIGFTLETIEKGISDEHHELKSQIDQVKTQIHHTYQEMRRISYRLHPAILSDLGLEPALDAYIDSITSHSNLAVDFKMVGFDGRLEPAVETVLYRLSQEALTNTVKHAHAKKFKLSIIKGYPHIIFVAEDNGDGFSPTPFHRSKNTLGLVSMRERAAMLGGTFSIRSAPGKGTRIRIEIPIGTE